MTISSTARRCPSCLTSYPQDAISARVRYQNVLSALSTLCGPPPLFKTLIEALTPRLVAIASPSPSFSWDEEPELPAAYLHALLAAIKRALAGKVDEGHADVAEYADSLVPVLYGLCVHAALHHGGGRPTRASLAWWAISLGWWYRVSRRRDNWRFVPGIPGGEDCLAVSWRAHYIRRRIHSFRPWPK
ncbi:hypothetical protein B0H13DRAFT_2022495, partial [Mycena leptocephala]